MRFSDPSATDPPQFPQFPRWHRHQLPRFLSIDRLAAALKVIHHEAAAPRFRELPRKAGYDALEIHNVLPALSPAIYAAASDSGLPIIHFLFRGFVPPSELERIPAVYQSCGVSF